MAKIENRKHVPSSVEGSKIENHQLRRGSVYIIVLSVSMMVTVIGLASLFAVRVQRRSAIITKDCAEARLCAQSAIELGLLYVQDPNWRQTWSNGIWLSNQPLGNGSFTLEGIDPVDGDLSDSDTDPLVLTGSGTKGIACHKTQVTLIAEIKPLEALNTCLHASGKLSVKNAACKITALGAPISTNGLLDNPGTIDGDAEADQVSSIGVITGTLTAPAENKLMPDPNVLSDYINKATILPFTGDVNSIVLAPGYNPWGPTNANGVYLIDTGGLDITIQNCRIHGTLIVQTGAGTLFLDNAVFIHSYRSDYPALIVEGTVYMMFKSGVEPLSETALDTNFNPAGAPYLGQSDDDTNDQYPNEIQGLVHVKGSLTLQQTAKITGAVICEGPVNCEGDNLIVHDPNLYANPPEGYTFVDGMKISPGSYKQVVD